MAIPANEQIHASCTGAARLVVARSKTGLGILCTECGRMATFNHQWPDDAFPLADVPDEYAEIRPKLISQEAH